MPVTREQFNELLAIVKELDPNDGAKVMSKITGAMEQLNNYLVKNKIGMELSTPRITFLMLRTIKLLKLTKLKQLLLHRHIIQRKRKEECLLQVQ